MNKELLAEIRAGQRYTIDRYKRTTMKNPQVTRMEPSKVKMDQKNGPKKSKIIWFL